MTRGLRPVDTVVFGFYLVLLALGVAVAVRTPAWLPVLVLSAASAVLWFVARRQLGSSFSVGAQASALVTTGLYARLRHPIYVFGTLAFLLVLPVVQGWGALVVGAVLIPVQVVRARREEAVLAAAFGPAYDAYRRATRC